MIEFSIFWDWLSFAARWVHVITVISWIGTSFYFIALDLGLRRADDSLDGVQGEEWQVHGGGFYHIQKFLVAPDRLPEHLTWFKWEAYATWLSGFALLAIIYYAGADLYLIDPNVLDITSTQGILISVASLGIGWVLYDLLCKSPLGSDNTRLMVLLYFMLVAMAWGYTQVFTGRAAFIHLGAFTATIMSANVFAIIMPNQRKVVADLIAGKSPDPALGEQAKQRSTHNNYLTLPIIFLMLANHYPLAFATTYNWIIASLVFLMGVSIRHYFNSKHSGAGNPTWTWPATALLFLAIMWLSTLPAPPMVEGETTKLTPYEQKFASAPRFKEVRELVQGRCVMCHTEEPGWDGLSTAPKNVKFDSDAQIVRRAREIYLHAGRSRAMP
ncbi:MAG: urate hydroxylase PuuD, partial [Rhodospirillales bacterium]|nr:urate hydroxylase PuuD [Rhodospirillales bacterium]